MDEENQRSVPVLPWMRHPLDVTRCEQLSLRRVPFLDCRLKSALENMKISKLFPVQVALWQETIGPGNFERDLCINSPTGSGKTLAYALPIVRKLLPTSTVKCLRALVVVPTRDLALQVKQVFDAIALPLGLRVGLAVGQSSVADEISSLVYLPGEEEGVDPGFLSPFWFQSKVDILVATPGRLVDHVNLSRGFTLKHLHYLVVDEADRLLREDYQSWLPTVLKSTQSSNNDDGGGGGDDVFQLGFPYSPWSRRSCSGVERGSNPHSRLAKVVLSATLTRDPGRLVQLNLHHPLFLSAGKMRYRLPENLESFKLICERKVKPLYLVALLKSLGEEKCIVFTRSVDSTHRLCKLLNCFGDLQIDIKEYSGRQHQRVRSKTLNEFRKGQFQVLVSSDEMTRGMDVEGVRNVINYDVPKYIKTYVHRAGRTARAGQTGRCFTLMSNDEVGRFKRLMKKAEASACLEHNVPSHLIEELHSTYQLALSKLKEIILESRRKPKDKSCQ
ncbi:DEAD-box ATP-dependent RNA helicase 1-like isoform X1 [Vigna radiata var. radiata]|uniref:ATP-dependent RNA helicase n=1 Tax=Vigna radiata var. radiata TaxID=3916 RepID=A0A1S3USH4_VIGRR|nr:DEAD-box ATP-dependent RNA helicase 1-like isoform X1 [Vigna radiata var. radiata]XP_014508968.1 DEAD-box ATP-dependent RNA helicase 1-like isoform X1 [Vigna radiata var. radiata]XP_014508970.1 DEAD-box ATP-dependent RNA helicase 1-like isoform X1 [Vigna radiata var. radiata]